MNATGKLTAKRVFLHMSGKDVSLAVRPLVHSFFADSAFKAVYTEDEKDAYAAAVSSGVEIMKMLDETVDVRPYRDAEYIANIWVKPGKECREIGKSAPENTGEKAECVENLFINMVFGDDNIEISTYGITAEKEAEIIEYTEEARPDKTCTETETEAEGIIGNRNKKEGKKYSKITFRLAAEEHVLKPVVTVASDSSVEESLKPDDETDASEYRFAAGRIVYDFLHERTGKTLPWGILVGIRPVKHVYQALAEGVAEDEIIRRFKEEDYVSDKRCEIAMKTAKNELRILSGFDYKNGCSIYIGIPFCPTTCLYCSFTSYPVSRFGQYMDSYLDALEKEIAYSAHALPRTAINTVYVGGGTPTALDEKNLVRLLEMIRKYLPMDKVLEFTVEAGRPDSLNPEKLAILKRYGVDRISINPQTFVQRTLDLIGRAHDVESVYRAYDMARAAGHDNINLDMIVGLTGENPDDVRVTLENVKRLTPESLTVHTLAIKRAARLNIERDKYKNRGATGISEMLEMTLDFAADNGYEPYYLYRQKNMAENLENIGYALPGKECLYNMAIMEEKQSIIALGAGSISKFVNYKLGEGAPNYITRCENVKDLRSYIERVDEMIERKRELFG